MAIPVSYQLQQPGMIDLAAGQRQQQALKQQKQQQTMANIMAIVEAWSKKQKETEAKKKSVTAREEAAKARKEGKQVKEVFDPSTGQWSISIEEPSTSFPWGGGMGMGGMFGYPMGGGGGQAGATDFKSLYDLE